MEDFYQLKYFFEGLKYIKRFICRCLASLPGVVSKNLWQRRFAIVLLIELSRHGLNKKEIKNLVEKVKDEKEPYVKKAIVWLNNELKKH